MTESLALHFTGVSDPCRTLMTFSNVTRSTRRCILRVMLEQDAQMLDHKTLEEIRIRAIKQVQAGQSPEVVIAELEFSRCWIYS